MKRVLLFILMVLMGIAWAFPGHAEMYQWVDEKGTVHFADDLSKIPERYRPGAKILKPPHERATPEAQEKPALPLPAPPTPKASEPEGIEVALSRRGGVFLTEVLLHGRVKRRFVVDTGASSVLISWETVKELDLTIDEETPVVPVATPSDVVLVPLVTLKSVRVGNAEVENVEALVQTMPSGEEGLLGQSFLNKFRVVLDAANGKMTLFPMQEKSSMDRPGGHNRDYWAGRFRFLHQTLAGLKKSRAKHESRGARSPLKRVDNAIRYFEKQLNELERMASYAGVPRNWRE